jgi:hypothetical protein
MPGAHITASHSASAAAPPAAANAAAAAARGALSSGAAGGASAGAGGAAAGAVPVRCVNVAIVEVRVGEVPALAVVTLADIPEGAELMLDQGGTHWCGSARVVTKAQNNTALNEELNATLNANKELEESYGPIIAEHQRLKNETVEARGAAVFMNNLWEESKAGTRLPLHIYGGVVQVEITLELKEPTGRDATLEYMKGKARF